MISLLLGLALVATPPRSDASQATICPQRLAAGVYVGPAPKSAADVAHLKRLGVREIIDIRTLRRLAMNREARWARKYGLAYRSLPIATRPSFPTRNLERTIERMVGRQSGAIYVHCSLGRDRAGLIAALYRYRYLGWSPQQAFREMERVEYNSRLVELDQYFWQSVKCAEGTSAFKVIDGRVAPPPE